MADFDIERYLASCVTLQLEAVQELVAAELARRSAAEKLAACSDEAAAAFEAAFKRYRVSRWEIVGMSREAHVCEARDYVVGQLRGAQLSLSKIGRIMGGRDHTSIAECERRYNQRVERESAKQAASR